MTSNVGALSEGGLVEVGSLVFLGLPINLECAAVQRRIPIRLQIGHSSLASLHVGAHAGMLLVISRGIPCAIRNLDHRRGLVGKVA